MNKKKIFAIIATLISAYVVFAIYQDKKADKEFRESWD